jgi:hypothetical protein
MLVDREKVELGVSLLDEKVPDWHIKINLKNLDMEWPDRCVMGQIGNGDMVNGLHTVGIYDVALPMANWGFDVTREAWDIDPKGSYEELTNIWKEIINERRNAQASS